jgi:F420-0:gamma-glutamyl ligase
MIIQAIKTPLFKKGEKLAPFIIRQLKKEKNLPKEFVLVLTSKLLSISENRLVSPQKISKAKLIKKTADIYLGKSFHDVHITIHKGLLIPSAGIDCSNSENGHFILFPKSPFASAQKILKEIKKQFRDKKIALLISDSRSTPLRKGITGVCLAHAGLKACVSKKGERDLYGRKLEATHVNVVDALTSAAVFLMGESYQRTPLALIKNAPVEYTSKKSSMDEVSISAREDLFFRVLKPKREVTLKKF